MSIYITGDTHGEFERIFDFCEENGTTYDDTLVILGDAGINVFLDYTDENLKEDLKDCPITLFMIHGNHEERPTEIDTYVEKEWNGGIVYYEEEYPNLLFAKDGKIYDLDGRKVVVIGGAYSVDKFSRIRSGQPWFDTEQPLDEIKEYVEEKLEKANWCVDYVFTHCAPYKYEPTWAFLPEVDQDNVDKTTEKWLDTIEERLDYTRWFCGHYHVEGQEGTVTIMYQDFDEL